MIRSSFPVKDFHLKATLESGQVFGFKSFDDETYQGSCGGIFLKLWQREDQIFFEKMGRGSPVAIEEHLRRYFDLGRDLNPLYALLEQDPKIPPLWHGIRGLRLIWQDPWEVIACFILSSNNNIKRIQQMWHRLANTLGREGKHFPTVEAIAMSDETVMRSLGLGYRAPYLLNTARLVRKDSQLLKKIETFSYPDAKELLMQFPGVGSKVADCILLYGFHKMEAFPVDVWIERILLKLYFRSHLTSGKKMLAFAQKRWGLHGGYGQQYLFHGVRTGVL